MSGIPVVVPVLLGVAWAVLGAAAVVVTGDRVHQRRRASRLVAGLQRVRRRSASGGRLRRRRGHRHRPVPPCVRAAAPVLLVAVRVGSDALRRRRVRREGRTLLAELPALVDLVAVAVAAGCTPYLAVEVATRWAPPSVSRRLRTVTRACALGARLSDALEALARSDPVLAPLATALATSERSGTPALPALDRLAAETRADVRRAAQARARTVPVRLLFPLVFLVLPAFGLLTVVPSLLAGLARTQASGPGAVEPTALVHQHDGRHQ